MFAFTESSHVLFNIMLNLKSITNSAVSSEIDTAEAVSVDDQEEVCYRFCSHHQAWMDEEELETGQDMEYRAWSMRNRSPSPSMAVHQKDEEMEEDPSYRQFFCYREDGVRSTYIEGGYRGSFEDFFLKR